VSGAATYSMGWLALNMLLSFARADQVIEWIEPVHRRHQ